MHGFCHLRATHLEAFEREFLARIKALTTRARENWASLKSSCLCDLMTYYTWGLCILQPVWHRVLSIQETLWIAGEWSMWRFGSLPWRLTRVIGRGLCDLSSRRIQWGLGVLSCVFRTGCPGLCVLRFKYLAAPTRRTVVTATGTGPTNHCLQRVTGFIFTSLYLLLLLVKSLYVCSIICLHWVTACSVWLHNIFLPDPYYLAAISHCAFTSLNTWLWFA